MKVKINKWLCPKGYAITLFGTIYVRTKDQYDKMVAPYSYYYNHELIHEKQANNKWIIFYIKYIYLYLKNILALRYNIKAPYYFHPMEIEAYKNQYDLNYVFTNNVGKEYKQYKYKIKDFYKGNCSYFEFISKL